MEICMVTDCCDLILVQQLENSGVKCVVLTEETFLRGRKRSSQYNDHKTHPMQRMHNFGGHI